jgi:hypothetical protein
LSPPHETFTFADDYGATITPHTAWWANQFESPDVAVDDVDTLAEQATLSWLHEPLKHADQAAHLDDYFHFA